MLFPGRSKFAWLNKLKKYAPTVSLYRSGLQTLDIEVVDRTLEARGTGLGYAPPNCSFDRLDGWLPQPAAGMTMSKRCASSDSIRYQSPNVRSAERARCSTAP